LRYIRSLLTVFKAYEVNVWLQYALTVGSYSTFFMESSSLQVNHTKTSLVGTDDCDDDTSDLAALCNQSGLNSFNHTPRSQLVLQSTALTGEATNSIPIPTSFPCLSPTSSAPMLIDTYQSHGFLMDGGTLGIQQQVTSATSSSASCMQITDHSSVVPSATPLFQLSTPTVLINSSDKVIIELFY